MSTVLKEAKEISMRHLISTAYPATTIPTLTMLGVELLLSFINVRKMNI